MKRRILQKAVTPMDSNETLNSILYTLGYLYAVLGYLYAVQENSHRNENWDDSDLVEIRLSKIHDLIETLHKAEKTIEELETYISELGGKNG